MKVFNRTKETKLQAHWPFANTDDKKGPIVTRDDQTLIELMPGRSLEVPDPLAELWLKKWPHIVMTDEEANRAVLASRAEIAQRDAEITALKAKLESTEKALLENVTAPGTKVDEISETKAQLAARDQEVAELKAMLDAATAPKKGKRKPEDQDEASG